MLTVHYPLRERQAAGLALTVLVHAALLLCWQLGRHLPAPDRGPVPARMRIQWLRLPAPPAPAMRPLPQSRQPTQPAQTPASPGQHPPALRSSSASSTSISPAPSAPAAAPAIALLPAAPPGAAAAAPPPAAAAPSAADILQRARRDIGKIDRALRKENKPYIVLPSDSPQIRLRQGMDAAHDMAPSRLWEAPKIEELVNNTGDGARRTRVITGNGTYCVTDRGINTSIDMIEKHGKQRLTNCPEHETPAGHQEWRTARD